VLINISIQQHLGWKNEDDIRSGRITEKLRMSQLETSS